MAAEDNGLPGFHAYSIIVALLIGINVVGYMAFWSGFLAQPPSQEVQPNESAPEKACCHDAESENIAPTPADANSENYSANDQEAANPKSKAFIYLPDNAPDTRDLFAQEGMWRAANVMAVLVLAQLFVGAATFYFLYLTFKTQRGELTAATRAAIAAETALKESRSATIREHRSYLSIDSYKIEFVEQRFVRTHLAVLVTFTIKNIGKTPASNIQAPQVIYAGLLLTRLNSAQEEYENADEALARSVRCFTLNPGQSYTFKTSARLTPPISEPFSAPDVPFRKRLGMDSSPYMRVVLWYQDISVDENERRHCLIDFVEHGEVDGRGGGDVSDAMPQIMRDEIGAILVDRDKISWLHPDGGYTEYEEGGAKPPTNI